MGALATQGAAVAVKWSQAGPALLFERDRVFPKLGHLRQQQHGSSPTHTRNRGKLLREAFGPVQLGAAQPRID